SRRVDERGLHQGSLAGVRLRQYEAPVLARGRERHRQRAADRPQFPRQGQIARELVLTQPFAGKLPRRGKYGKRDRKIETSRLLAKIGRREIDGDAARGKV